MQRQPVHVYWGGGGGYGTVDRGSCAEYALLFLLFWIFLKNLIYSKS